MTTTFSKQVEILSDIYTEQWDKYEDFILSNDLGVPLSVLIMHGCAIPTDTGVSEVNDSFVNLCALLQIDVYGEYDSIDEMESISEQG